MLVMLQPGRWLGDGRLCCPFLLLRKYWRAVAQCSLTRTSQRGVSHNGFEPGFSCPCKWNGNGCGHLYSTVLLQAIRMPACPREGRKRGWGELFNTPGVAVFLLHWLLCFSAPPGSLPSVTGPPPGTIPGMPPRPGLPPPGAPRMDLGVSCMHKFTGMCSHLCAYMSVKCTCKTPVWR